MKKGSRLANWETFSIEFSNAVLAYIEEHHQVPQTRQLAAAGHQRLVNAVYRHHGGYIKSLVRCNFPLPPRKEFPLGRPRPWTPPKIIVPKKPTRLYGYWTRRDVQMRTLRRSFPDELGWRYMPASTDVLAKHQSLATHFLRSWGGWNGSARRLGLLPTRQGRSYLRIACAIFQSWDFRALHGRWPLARECSPLLRHVRFRRRGRTWESFPLQPLPRSFRRRLALRAAVLAKKVELSRPEFATWLRELAREYLRPKKRFSSSSSK